MALSAAITPSIGPRPSIRLILYSNTASAPRNVDSHRSRQWLFHTVTGIAISEIIRAMSAVSAPASLTLCEMRRPDGPLAGRYAASGVATPLGLVSPPTDVSTLR